MNDLKNIIEDVNKSEIVSDKVIKKIIEIIGQEEWHELHDEYNDVITTTGELAICLRSLEDLEQENEQLKAQLREAERQYETCPYRSTDMGCDYCDYRDRDLKDEWEVEE